MTDVEGHLRELTPQVLGHVARRHGSFYDAEDAVQEALVAAAVQWPDEGLPEASVITCDNVITIPKGTLDAARLGMDRRHIGAKGLQYGVALAGLGGDDGEDVDHGCGLLRWDDRRCHPKIADRATPA